MDLGVTVRKRNATRAAMRGRRPIIHFIRNAQGTTWNKKERIIDRSFVLVNNDETVRGFSNLGRFQVASGVITKRIIGLRTRLPHRRII